MISAKAQRGIAIAALLFTAVFPFVFSNPAVTTIAIFTLMYAASATAWNIFSGYTGYVALGHAAFFGTGCYTIALICEHWNIPAGYQPFLFVPVAGLVAAAVSIPVGAIALRTRRHTFVVITIAIFFIFQLMSFNLSSITNGSTGLSLPTLLLSGEAFNLPFYYVSFIILLLALGVSIWARQSKYGLMLLAIRDDEDRARGLGVKADIVKLSAFVISAFFVGMVGAVWAYFLQSVYPAFAFDPLFDVALALIVFLGGPATIIGPLLGTLLVIPTQQYFQLVFSSNGLYLIVYGALFLAVILFLPEGIIPTARKRWMARRARLASQAAPPTEPQVRVPPREPVSPAEQR